MYTHIFRACQPHGSAHCACADRTVQPRQAKIYSPRASRLPSLSSPAHICEDNLHVIQKYLMSLFHTVMFALT